MPYIIEKIGDFCYSVSNLETDKIYSYCSTLENAQAQKRILENYDRKAKGFDKFKKVEKLAKKYGATDIRESKKKYKKYDVLYNKKWISFGDNRYEDFLEHKDSQRRLNYRSRASHIKDKQGRYTYLNPNSPNYWSYWVLW